MAAAPTRYKKLAKPATRDTLRGLSRKRSPELRFPLPTTAPPSNDRCKRALGQGKRNFDMARRGSYLHLVPGDRPRSHRSSFGLSHP
jgi:hypothetical protein